MKIKGVLIDPFAQTIEWIEIERGIEGIYAALQARPIDVIGLGKTPDGRVHSLYIDDEGLFREGQKFWQTSNMVRPLAGRGLILGCDGGGDDIDATVDIASIRKETIWRPNIEFDGLSPGSERESADGWVHIDLGKARFRPKEEKK